MPSQSGKKRLAMKFYTSGRVAEFPNISLYEDDFETARHLMNDAIQTLKKIADQNRMELPLPIQYR